VFRKDSGIIQVYNLINVDSFPLPNKTCKSIMHMKRTYY
jgi:hypothetical protein